MWKYLLTYFIILNVATFGIVLTIREFLFGKLNGVFRIWRRIIYFGIFAGSLAAASVPIDFQAKGTKGESVGDAIFAFFIMFLIGAIPAGVVIHFFTLVQKRILGLQIGNHK